MTQIPATPLAPVFQPTHVIISKGRRRPVCLGTALAGSFDLYDTGGSTGWYWVPASTLLVQMTKEGAMRPRPDARLVKLASGDHGGGRPKGVDPASKAGRAAIGRAKVHLIVDAWVPDGLRRLAEQKYQTWPIGAAPSVIVTELVREAMRKHNLDVPAVVEIPAKFGPRKKSTKKSFT